MKTIFNANSKARIIKRPIMALVMEFDDLTDELKELLGRAVKVRKHAQAPYSHYFVGAAVKSVSGKIYSGCNVERATWTQTTHAEQNAVDTMVAREGGGAQIDKVAIVHGLEGQDVSIPPMRVSGNVQLVESIPVPCGHCLQIIWENGHGDTDIEILGICKTGEIAIITIDNALPLRFGPKDLGVQYAS